MENWKNLMHVFVTIFLSNFASLLVNPTIADVTMEAVCPGKDECSLSIYLSGFQQAIAGLASVVMMPLIGNLSDTYGRKLLLTIPLTLAIIPFVILATKRTTEFFYVYYVVKTLTSTVTDGGTICLALSYMADNVSEGKRVSAFGIFSGVVSAAMVCGTLTARILPTDRINQVAAVVAIVAAVYMRIFLEDDRRMAHLANDGVEQPMLKSTTEEERNESLKTTDLMKLPKDMYRLFKTSNTVSLASFVAFFNSLAEAGISAFLMYFLKARFHFQKNQFADIWLITYAAATFSTMVLMPLLGPILGEETLLCIGLFAGFLNMLLDSIAWAPWVPYASAFLGIFLFLASPSIRCIISRKVGAHDQGIAQGCLMGIASLANVVSPLIFSPLSALFLSDDAPFNFPGFSILSVGLAYLIAFFISIVIKIQPHCSTNNACNHSCSLA
ncbi:hippocampus abundant transcript 1 protein-like [Salvia hispanica]|uniref:hippocampus abundant transcript 1 protein-like n=1 Tax=Salvia hispanica TaxID=49212 RepID=UPI0020099CAE|nr:hippocampus abundant transcript 1 protein-like [Salvia hispanica]